MTASKGNLFTLPGCAADDRPSCEAEAFRRVREGRRLLALQVLDYAIELGVSPDSIKDYLAGRTKVPGWVLIRVERLLVKSGRKVA